MNRILTPARKREMSPEDRAYAKRRIALKVGASHDGCLLWQGGVDSRGNGLIVRLRGDNGSSPVHRVAYESDFGPIPDGLRVLRGCGHKLCVNTEHIHLGKWGEISPVAVDECDLCEDVVLLHQLGEPLLNIPKRVGYTLAGLESHFRPDSHPNESVSRWIRDEIGYLKSGTLG
jgi:hypothetical protein